MSSLASALLEGSRGFSGIQKGSDQLCLGQEQGYGWIRKVFRKQVTLSRLKRSSYMDTCPSNSLPPSYEKELACAKRWVKYMLTLHFKGSAEDTLRLWAFLQRGWEGILTLQILWLSPTTVPEAEVETVPNSSSLTHSQLSNNIGTSSSCWRVYKLPRHSKWPLDGSPAEF